MSHETPAVPETAVPETAVPEARTDHSHPTGVRTYGLVARSAAEATGSFLLVLAGVGVTILSTQSGLQPTLAFGLVLIAAMIAFGYVSGGHFNPAITLGSAAAGRTDWTSVLPYIAAQILGALAASGLLWLLLSANSQLASQQEGLVQTLFSAASNGFDERSSTQFPLISALLAEVVAAAIFTAVYLGATGKSADRAVAPFAVGLAYAALLTMLLPITNGSLNPARSTSTALFAEDWAVGQLWLFWAAPVLGAVIAGLIYRSMSFGVNAVADRKAAELRIEDASDGTHPEEQATSRSSTAAADASAGKSGPVQTPPRDDARTFFDGDAGSSTAGDGRPTGK